VVFTNEDHITGGIPLITQGSSIMISDHLGTTLSVDEKPISSTAYGEGLTEGRFTSKIFIPELNSYLFPCRLYSASATCWTTEDPTGFPDGANNHAYALNDPTGNVDPLGTVAWDHYGPFDRQSFGGQLNSATPALFADQTVAADKSGNCFIHKMTRGRTYSAASTMHVTSATYYQIQGSNVLSSSTAFRNDLIDHETEHKDLRVAMAAKTHKAYEDWSANYGSTNLFPSAPDALSAFNADVTAATTATISKYNANLCNDNASGHPPGYTGGGPGLQSGTRVISGNTYNNYPMVVNKPIWGAAAKLAISQITITIPEKTAGTCEN